MIIRNLFILFVFLSFTNLLLSQSGKNSLIFSNSINTVYKRNGVFTFFDENYGNSLHTEFNINYYRDLLNTKKVQLKLGTIISCEFLKLKYKSNPFSIDQAGQNLVVKNWILYPGVSIYLNFPLNSKIDYNLSLNQFFGNWVFSTKASNSVNEGKQSDNNFNNDIFTKTNFTTGFSYKFYQKETKSIRLNIALGSDLLTRSSIFSYRYYTNFGLFYSY